MVPLYFEQVLELALLSRADEQALARRWRKFGDLAARNRLIQAHLRLVPPIARRYYRPGASLSELVAEGNLGLLRATAKFEPERGHRFATYAIGWIRAHVSECAIRSSEPSMNVPRALRSVRREHARATGVVTEDVEVRKIIAERLQMSAARVSELIDLLHCRAVPVEALRALGPNPEQVLLGKAAAQSLRDTVRNALSSLNARERRIVDRRLMADVGSTLTLSELGLEFGVTRERVRQLETIVKRKLGIHLRALSEISGSQKSKFAA